MNSMLLRISALAVLNVSAMALGFVEAHDDHSSLRSRSELFSRSTQPISSRADRNVQLARSGHGGQEEEYFRKKHRLDRADHSG